MKILITGTSRGIGKSLCDKFLSEGHNVWGISRSQPDRDSPLFRHSQCDLENTLSMEKTAQEMVEQNFIPDIIILNAAIDLEEELPEISYKKHRSMFAINVDGAYFWVSYFMPHFLKRNSGQFIAISSLFAIWSDPSSVSYSASKSALSQLFKALSLRYENTPVEFKTFILGPVATTINPRFSESNNKKSLTVASPENTALKIYNSINQKKSIFYYPLYILILCKFFFFLPDHLFHKITKPFKR